MVIFDSVTKRRIMEFNLDARFGLKSRGELSKELPLLVLVNPKAGDGRGKGIFERRAERLLNMAGRRWGKQVVVLFRTPLIPISSSTHLSILSSDTQRLSQKAGASRRTIASRNWETCRQVEYFFYSLLLHISSSTDSCFRLLGNFSRLWRRFGARSVQRNGIGERSTRAITD